MRRWEWLADKINGKGWTKGAEIGVKAGKTLFYLLEHCPQLHMVGVDVWQPQPSKGEWGYTDWDHESNERLCLAQASYYIGRVSIYKMMSVKVASDLILDDSLDFVFIDACHDTESVTKDIWAWMPKIKSGGLLCGHDAGKPTVRAALNDWLEGWQLVPHDSCWEYAVNG